jgi:hypothetical protein
MFNTAPIGDQPRTVIQIPVEPRHNQFNGDFYYHPRWQDGATNRGHYIFQSNTRPGSTPEFGIGNWSSPTAVLTDTNDVFSLEVAGYDLVAIGSIRTKGQDLDISLVQNPWHLFRSGYLVMGQERNPYVLANMFPGVGNYGERPRGDGIPDMYIIHLGSGMDKKVSTSTND